MARPCVGAGAGAARADPRLALRPPAGQEEAKGGDGGKGDDGERHDEEQDGEEDGSQLSKKKLRKQKRLSVAELKALVHRPDLVEAWDVTSSDPRLLLYLKSYRNTVPVPRHWCHKRKYLQGKRGIERGPFELPDFVAATGITKMREALDEANDSKSGKARMREKMRGKMGKIKIDYEVLYNAFFRFQTKPRMTGHGDIYYEGKEFEVNYKEKRPGHLSQRLKVRPSSPTVCD